MLTLNIIIEKRALARKQSALLHFYRIFYIRSDAGGSGVSYIFSYIRVCVCFCESVYQHMIKLKTIETLDLTHALP